MNYDWVAKFFIGIVGLFLFVMVWGVVKGVWREHVYRRDRIRKSKEKIK